MVIVVDVAADRVELAEPGDFRRFHVAAHGDGGPTELARALERARAGRLEGRDAVISAAWVRAQVAGKAGAEWEEGFRGMLSFAGSNGWLRDGGAGIQAHVVWESSAGETAQ